MIKKMNTNRILSIGDVSFDVFITPRLSETLCRKEEGEQYICFSYGDKIPVDSVSYYPGGCAANVAIGLKRLGIDVSLCTTFGDDSLIQQSYRITKNEPFLRTTNHEHICFLNQLISSLSYI